VRASRRNIGIAGGAAVGLAGIAAGALVLFGVLEGSAHPIQPNSFAFDSLYEVRRGESVVTEEIVKREMNVEAAGEGEENEAEQPKLESKVLVKSERCSVSPPPPAATRLLCRVLVSIEELHSTSKASHVNGWSAVVHLNPHNGALAVSLSKLSGET
jgi:hypothetical protein